jgi:hypothetical protein
VRRTVQRLRAQGLVFGPPKSPRSRRSIPLPESSRAALLSHRERHEVERLKAGDSWQESGLGFTTSVGTVVEPKICPGLRDLVQRSGRSSHQVLRSTPYVRVAASGAGCVAPCADGCAGPFSAFDHHGFVLPCDVECLAGCRGRNGSGAKWRSMTLDRCCHRCCQSWFDGDR